MSDGKNLRLGLVIEAIDKATSTITRINAKVESMAKPVNTVIARLHHLGEASGLGRLRERMHGVHESAIRVGEAGRRLVELEAYVGLLGGALFETTRRVSEVNQQISKNAILTALSTGEWQRLSYAAKQYEVDQGTVVDTMRFLNRNVVEALAGNKQLQQTFNAVGVSMQDLRTKAPLDILYKISDWMERIPNKARQGYVAMTLLGRGGTAALPMFQEGSKGLKNFGDELERLRGIVTPEQLQRADEYDRSLHRVQAVVGVLASRVGAELLPAMTRINEKIVAWAQKNPEAVDRFASKIAKLTDRLPELVDGFIKVTAMLGAIGAIVLKVADIFGGLDHLIAIIAGVRVAQMLLAIGQLTLAFGKLGIALLTTPFGWMALGLAGVAAGIYAVYQNLDFLEFLWDRFWTNAKNKPLEFIGWFLRAINPLAPFFQLLDYAIDGAAAADTTTTPADAGGPRKVRIPFAAPRPVFGAPAPTVTSPGKRESNSRIDVGGRVDIRFSQDGRARIVRADTNGPLDFNVSSGPLALGGGW